MPHSTDETRSQDFQCPKLGGVARVTLSYKRIRLPNGPDKVTLVGLDCEQAYDCGVGVWNDTRTSATLDYTGKCEHPECIRRRSPR